jgi:DNA-directed RNA polymerase III subunit RPC5
MDVDLEHQSPPSSARRPSTSAATVGDGEDEVVAEIDVILSNMDDSLDVYLAQYPLRPPWRPYDPEDLAQVRFRRQYHILEMDYDLTLDKTAPDKDAMEVVERGDGAKEVDENGLIVGEKLKKHTLRSSAVPLRTNYAMGLYRGNALYLTPLTGILQMRPSFADLEDVEETKRRTLDEYAAQKTENVGLRIDKKRPEDEKAAAARDKSYTTMKLQEEADAWKTLEFVDRDRDEAVGIFEMIASTEGDSAAKFDVSRKEYLAMINPVQAQLEEEQKRQIIADRELLDPSQTDPSKKRKKDLHESDLIPRLSAIGGSEVHEPAMQIKAIMWNCGIATFSTLRRLTSFRSDQELANLLDASCVFVSGRWILKSDIVCKSERLAMARQALLVQWAQDDKTRISRRAHANLWRVDPEDLKRVLLPIADLLPAVYGVNEYGQREEIMSPGWILKLANDFEPAGHYEKLSKRYKTVWRDIGIQLEKQIDNLQYGTSDGVGVGLGLGSGQKVLDVSLFENRATVDPATSQELQAIIRGLLINHSVIKIDFLRQQIAAKANAGELKVLSPNVSDVVLKQELAVSAEPIHEVWVRRCGVDWGLKDEQHRKAVYQLFSAAKDRKIKRKDVESAVFEKTGTPIPRNTYTALMKELAVIVGGSWVLKTGDGTQTTEKDVPADD